MANKQKQMLAVWGSPGAGKTVTAVKLAAELAKRKKNVVLAFTDLTAPPLPAVAAEGKLPEVSVGELLSAPGMTQEQVLKTCVPCEKHPYISFLGYKAGENVFTYAEYSKEKAVDMLVLLRHIADYVIVDCTSVLTGNVLATAALEVADDVLRVCGCDLKAISYFASAEGKLPEVSVGELLSAPGMTQEQVLKTCVPCEKHPYISFLGYKAGENVFTYAEYSKEKAVDMLVLLRHIADYVIVDCTSVLTGNVLATAALEVADDVLRVCGCDLKAISYFASYLPLIEDRKFKPEQHIRALSNTRPYQGGMEYENSFGGVKYRLPYLPIVEEQAATLKLLEPLAGKEAKSYEPVIAAIAAEVFGDGK